MSTRADPTFFHRDTIEVARELLGQTLERRWPGGRTLRGRIVETEAYLGPHDPACHTFGHRRTPRTESMYGRPGIAYVYFIYGVHFCFNVVTAEPGAGEAVLIRAVEIRGESDPLRAAGPGKLCRAFEITRAFDGLDLTKENALTIELQNPVAPADVLSGARVGLGDRHDAVHWPLRFGLRGSGSLSRPRFDAPP